MEDNRDERVPMESARRDLTNKKILWAKNNKESSIILFSFLSRLYILRDSSYLGIHIVRVYRLYAVFLDIELFVFPSSCTTRHICDDDAIISKRNCLNIYLLFYSIVITHSKANKNKLKGIDDEYKPIEIMAPVIWTRL